MLRSDKDRDRGFRVLISRYGDRLYRHIHRLCDNPSDADDILQETLIKVFRHAGQFEGRSRFYTWLYRVATNEALSFLQHKSKSGMGEEGARELGRMYADPWWDTDEAWRSLEAAIRELPDKQRAVFNLRYFEEMSYEEMSQILDTSVGALKASFHHALKKVERHLRDSQSQI